MFRSVNEKSKPGAQPVSGDERVRKEAQFEEDLQSSGSAGNEDANVKFMEMLLDPENKYGPREGRRGPLKIRKSCSLIRSTVSSMAEMRTSGTFLPSPAKRREMTFRSMT